MSKVLIILIVFFTVRFVSLAISLANEKRLKAEGAIQFGRLNSFFLSVTHFLFYVFSFYEAYIQKITFNTYSKYGLCLMIFGYTMLFFIMYQLRAIWTVKIYIAPNHKVVRSFLFRTIRHPNYFLNIIPELVGVALLCNAWKTLTYIFPLYLVILVIRIIQEEAAMKRINKDNL
ncbi:isoprenylcysteine carboxyl methyltransferase family protein [Flavobacterium sp. N502540]|uniref:isoprenylcysteine carboxyl methyltransferase family protein n=1 Tax=Flavobacterium sp. N502540 TaxID=2986838 RepID=UPI0022259D41|nr:isoprenylcysteine carboxyl methyltransferase family protein [Flavobacterium sp. N502540]